MTEERCDWVGCKEVATVRSIKPKPDPPRWSYPRPCHTAYELFFCEEHGRIQKRMAPGRIEEPAR